MPEIAPSEELLFKHLPINKDGQQTTMLSCKGRVTDSDIELYKQTLPLSSVVQVVRRQQRLALVTVQDGEVKSHVIEVTGGGAKKVKQRIDQVCSRRWVLEHQQKLERQGQAAKFRQEDCPHCRSTLDLTGFGTTPQLYCTYCETLSILDEDRDKGDEKYRLCDECGYFGQPRPFTSFYFVFLVVFYYYQHQTDVKCHACMRSSAWKMFWGNLLFVLGAPFAIAQLIRAYWGGEIGSRFAGLDSANMLARKGKSAKAQVLYERILDKQPVAAGVRLDMALAHAQAQEWDFCIVAAKQSLDDCSNYLPAANVMVHALKASGRDAEAESFMNLWNACGASNGDDDVAHA